MKFIDIETKRVGNTTRGGRARMGFDEIRSAINMGSKTDKYPTLRTVLGLGVIDQLRLKKGDGMRVKYTNDGLWFKRDPEAQFKLHNNGKSHNLRIQFPLWPDMPHSTDTINIPSQTVKFEYYEGGILIDWPQEITNGS